MRHEHADLGFVFMDRPRDLQCGEYDAAWSVQDDVEWNFIVREGGLMSYGPGVEDSLHQAALYIDRILKGAKPTALPAEQPTRYYFTVNLKTATTLGLTIPPLLMQRADDVIQ